MSDGGLEAINDLATAGDGEALYRLGLAHLGSRELELAEAAFRAADAVGNEHALGQVAWVLDISGREEEAEVVYREAISRGDTLALVHFADMILVDETRHGEAEALLNQAIAADIPSAGFTLAKLLARQVGREVEAEATFRAVADPSLRGFAQVELSRLLSRLPGREADAEQAMLESGHLADGELAEILYRRGQHDDAVAAQRRAAELGGYGAWNNLTVMLKELGRVDEAQAAYRDGIRAGETDLFVHFGNYLNELGHVAEAESVLRQGLQYDARCGYVLGAILLRDPDRFEEGRSWLIKAAGSGVLAAALYLGRMRD